MNLQRTALSAATCALVPSLSWALNLGELQGQALLNQPLAARIEIYASASELALPASVTVLPDLFNPGSGDLQALVASMRGQVVRDANGDAFAVIQSALPLSAAPVDFRLHIQLGDIALVRRYTVHAQAAPSARSTTFQRARRARPQGAPIAAQHNESSDHYGPVRPGESLWSIAQRLGTRNRQQLMSDIFAANPAAFVNGDRAQLKQGVTLIIPKQETAAAPVTAPATTPAPAPLNPPADLAPAALSATDVAIKNEATAQVTTTAPAVSLSDPALTARLAKLDEKFAAIRAQYGDTPKPQVVTEPEPRSTSSATPQEKKKPITNTTSAPAPTVTSAEVVSPPLSIGSVVVSLFVVAILAGCGWLFSKVKAWRRNALATSERTGDDELKAAVALKAEQRLRARELAVTSEASEFETTLSASDFESLITEPETDAAYHEIDVNIAHGRYVEAERLLHDVVKSAPQNVEAKTRLAEVYYITERVAEFANTAAELQTHRSELKPGEWQRIVRMGKKIAPDLALFENSRGLERRAS